MKSSAKPIIVLLVVIIAVGGSVAYCNWPSDSSEEQFSVTGQVTGLSSYNQPMLDVEANVLLDAGLTFGSLFTIEVDDMVFRDAALLDNYLGVVMFGFFVNVETNGFISVGCVGKLITAENGTEITLTHTGTSEAYKTTPNYNRGPTDNRSDYSDDYVFANFSEVTGGDLKPGILYRSFSPLYSPAKQSRSTYVNELAEEANIQFEIALSYTDATVAQAVANLDGYCLTLCEEGKYVAPGMGYLYFQQKEKTTAVLTSILDNDGAYLIHCNIGRDRTGYMVLLLQALCKCTPEEMMACEAGAFCNLYHIEVGSEEYDTVVNCTYDRNMYLIANYDKIPDIFEIDWDNIDVSQVDTYSAAYNYCTEYLGLTDEQVNGIIAKLCD